MVTELNIKLADDTVKNIQQMAPHLTEKQQQITFGLLLGLMSENTKSAKLESPMEVDRTQEDGRTERATIKI